MIDDWWDLQPNFFWAGWLSPNFIPFYTSFKFHIYINLIIKMNMQSNSLKSTFTPSTLVFIIQWCSCRPALILNLKYYTLWTVLVQLFWPLYYDGRGKLKIIYCIESPEPRWFKTNHESALQSISRFCTLYMPSSHLQTVCYKRQFWKQLKSIANGHCIFVIGTWFWICWANHEWHKFYNNQM